MQFLLQSFGKNYLNLKNIVGVDAEVARRYLGFHFSLCFLSFSFKLLLLTFVLFTDEMAPKSTLAKL